MFGQFAVMQKQNIIGKPLGLSYIMRHKDNFRALFANRLQIGFNRLN